ncbi:uncharacterized protein LOC110102165 isoform X2 [Dendrobium catenatum]|uniref:uncharacterized protein LOC110102165 isoform X2 n=1 Tax=Dendrobium catenatum TaxID=906689 RepID=UPI00109F038B|nr:uncharacterized protein LOC110102165 isoform X2 [Dendrobium catenatum]
MLKERVRIASFWMDMSSLLFSIFFCLEKNGLRYLCELFLAAGLLISIMKSVQYDSFCKVGLRSCTAGSLISIMKSVQCGSFCKVELRSCTEAMMICPSRCRKVILEGLNAGNRFPCCFILHVFILIIRQQQQQRWFAYQHNEVGAICQFLYGWITILYRLLSEFTGKYVVQS